MRGTRNIIRNPAVILLRFCMYQALCLMLGSVWWGTGKNVIAGIDIGLFMIGTVLWATG